MSEHVIEKNQQFFATLYAFILQTQGLHWNITGSAFFELHAFFEEVYDDLSEAIDPLAERIRYMGAYPSSTLSALTTFSKLEEVESHDLDARKMVDLFLKSAHTIKSLGQDMLHLYENDPVSQDYYVGILSKLDVHIWKAQMYQH